MGIKKEGKKGFTIIEVVLVLAIAGLIFMMVFIALPALQRSQRDTQRKSDLSRLQTAVTQYTSNNRGNLPDFAATGDDSFISNYLAVSGDTFIDPLGDSSKWSGDYYVLDAASSDALNGKFADNQNVIYYTEGYTCGSSGNSVTKSGSRKVALRIYLEGGGVACQNN